MKSLLLLVAALSLGFMLTAHAGTAEIGTEFTYQGNLADAGMPANGSYDFEFTLHDAESGGTLLGSVPAAGVTVSNGDFSVLLDFGSMAFTGEPRWLELNVRAVGESGFTQLAPRQQVTPAPYAIRASQSEVADGAVFADVAASAQSVAYLNITGRPDALCVDAQGAPGVVLGGVCLLAYDNTAGVVWNTAVSTCISRGGDLCSASQYQTLRTHRPDPFYLERAVWSNDFSDNDAGVKTVPLRSSDDPHLAQLYGFGCCGLATPEPHRSQAETHNGVLVTFLRPQEDTTWDAAAMICHNRGADLCSKSQYVALNDAGLFSASVRRATDELSDNDGGLFSTVVGSNASDNGNPTQHWAFACCATQRLANGSCPVTPLANGLCVGDIHDIEDADFFTAARACTASGADLCSKSQMQALRNAGMFDGQCWTRDGADNDSSRAGGLLDTQPDNPDPGSTLMGYACCF